MKFNKPPFQLQPNQQLAPSSLNANFLSAYKSIKEYMDQRWVKHTLSSAGNIFYLTTATGHPYIIDRINLLGVYVGATVSFGLLSGTMESHELPATFSGNLYGQSFFPGQLMSGSDGAQLYKIEITGANVANMAISVDIRTDRYRGTAPTIGIPTQWRDGDVLTAAEFLSERSNLTTAANSSIALVTPPIVTSVVAQGVTSTAGTTIRIPGSGDTTVQRIVGYIEVDGTGVVGQNVLINYGFGTAPNVITRSVAGLTTATFSAVPGLTRSGRTIANSADDIVFTVTTTTGGTAIKRVWIQAFTRPF